MSITPVSNINYNNVQDKSMKRKILATAALGTSVAFGVISYKQGFRISKLAKSPVKDWALLKLKDGALKIEEKEVLGLAGGSVAGGLVGGALFDKKENFNAKLQESLSQLLGNVSVPIACVSAASRFYRAKKDAILKHVPQLKGEDKGFVKYTNRVLKAIPPVGLTGVALGVGIIGGNKVCNFINEKLSGKKVERGIKGSDFAPHVDDLCLAITLMSPGTVVGDAISKTVPFFLTVPGYQTGIAQKKD